MEAGGKELSWTERQMSPETLERRRRLTEPEPQSRPEGRKIPLSPLDGGEGGEDETGGGGMEALERAAGDNSIGL